MTNTAVWYSQSHFKNSFFGLSKIQYYQLQINTLTVQILHENIVFLLRKENVKDMQKVCTFCLYFYWRSERGKRMEKKKCSDSLNFFSIVFFCIRLDSEEIMSLSANHLLADIRRFHMLCFFRVVLFVWYFIFALGICWILFSIKFNRRRKNAKTPVHIKVYSIFLCWWFTVIVISVNWRHDNHFSLVCSK